MLPKIRWKKKPQLFLIEIVAGGWAMKPSPYCTASSPECKHEALKILDKAIFITPRTVFRVYDLERNTIYPAVTLSDLYKIRRDNVSLVSKGGGWFSDGSSPFVNFKIHGMWGKRGVYLNKSYARDMFKWMLNPLYKKDRPRYLQETWVGADEWHSISYYVDNIFAVKDKSDISGWLLTETGIDQYPASIEMFPGVGQYVMGLEGDLSYLVEDGYTNNLSYTSLEMENKNVSRPLILVKRLDLRREKGYIVCDTVSNKPFLISDRAMPDLLTRFLCFNARLCEGSLKVLEPLTVDTRLPTIAVATEPPKESEEMIAAIDLINTRVTLLGGDFDIVSDQLEQTLKEKVPDKAVLLKTLLHYVDTHLDCGINFGVYVTHETLIEFNGVLDFDLCDFDYMLEFGEEKLAQRAQQIQAMVAKANNTKNNSLDEISECFEHNKTLWIQVAMYRGTLKYDKYFAHPRTLQWLQYSDLVQQSLSGAFRLATASSLRHFIVSDKLKDLGYYTFADDSAIPIDHIPYSLGRIESGALSALIFTGESLVIADRIAEVGQSGLAFRQVAVKFLYIGMCTRGYADFEMSFAEFPQYVVCRSDWFSSNGLLRLIIAANALKAESLTVVASPDGRMLQRLRHFADKYKDRVALKFVDKTAEVNQYIDKNAKYRLQHVQLAASTEIPAAESYMQFKDVEEEYGAIVGKTIIPVCVISSTDETRKVAKTTEERAHLRYVLKVFASLREGLNLVHGIWHQRVLHGNNSRLALVSPILHEYFPNIIDQCDLTATGWAKSKQLYTFLTACLTAEEVDKITKEYSRLDGDSRCNIWVGLPKFMYNIIHKRIYRPGTGLRTPRLERMATLVLSLVNIIRLLDAMDTSVFTEREKQTHEWVKHFVYSFAVIYPQTREWVVMAHDRMLLGDREWLDNLGLTSRSMWRYLGARDNDAHADLALAYLDTFYFKNGDLATEEFKQYIDKYWRKDDALKQLMQEWITRWKSTVAWVNNVSATVNRNKRIDFQVCMTVLFGSALEGATVKYLQEPEAVDPAKVDWVGEQGWNMFGYTMDVEKHKQKVICSQAIGELKPVVSPVTSPVWDECITSIGFLHYAEMCDNLKMLRSSGVNEDVNVLRLSMVRDILYLFGRSIGLSHTDLKRLGFDADYYEKKLSKVSVPTPNWGNKDFLTWFHTGGLLMGTTPVYPKFFAGVSYKEYAAENGVHTVFDIDKQYFTDLFSAIIKGLEDSFDEVEAVDTYVLEHEIGDQIDLTDLFDNYSALKKDIPCIVLTIEE